MPRLRWLLTLSFVAALGCDASQSGERQTTPAVASQAGDARSPTSAERTTPNDEAAPRESRVPPLAQRAASGAAVGHPGEAVARANPAADGAPPRRFDSRRVQAAGLRELRSTHLILYTDLPASDPVDQLPRLLDLAVPQWAEYFGMAAAEVEDWRLQGYLMRDREPFASLGMLPAGREVGNGLAVGHEIWISEQPTDYYRRHLLLHEATHAFMFTQLGSCGPGWYMEGMAELLATHRVQEGELQLGIMPRARQEVPMLGRIKLIQDAVASGDVRSIEAVLKIDNRRALDNRAYAWCWALTKLLDTHPRYRERFHQLPRHVRRPDFDAVFRRHFESDWRHLTVQWHTFVTELDHDYSIDRAAFELADGQPLTSSQPAAPVRVAADRGWQPSGIWLEAGESYQVRAEGRYQVDDEPQSWWCEPGGVTLTYHRGRPLGMLLGALLPAAGKKLEPFAIGLEKTITPQQSGTLYLKINESPGSLADNQGELIVRVSRRGS